MTPDAQMSMVTSLTLSKLGGGDKVHPLVNFSTHLLEYLQNRLVSLWLLVSIQETSFHVKLKNFETESGG